MSEPTNGASAAGEAGGATQPVEARPIMTTRRASRCAC